MIIEQVSQIYSRVIPAIDIVKIKKCLEYESVYWKQGPFSKKRESSSGYLCDARRGQFLSGLIPRIKTYCETNGMSLTISEAAPIVLPPRRSAKLPGINLRPDQQKLISCANEYNRGLIVAPPGAGKTVLAGAIISQYPLARAIFVVHTKSLFEQTREEMRNWFGNDVGYIGSGGRSIKRINVFMAQAAHRAIQLEDQLVIDCVKSADIIVIDEAHHEGNAFGHYSSILGICKAAIRIGFTATPRQGRYNKDNLVCEGYIGPVIGELTMEEGIKQGIIAVPALELISVPKTADISACKTYHEQHLQGIILNRTRNRLIAKCAAAKMAKGESVMIMIVDVEHGHGSILQDMIRDVCGYEAAYIDGSTPSDKRESIKKQMISKELMCVIATTAWKEGINIPSLDCIINAAGGRSDTAVRQTAGRASRATSEKSEFTIVDFLDPYRSLSEHTVDRLQEYKRMGCL